MQPIGQLHAAARRGFERGADAYERGRPSYPGEAIAWMVDRLGLGPGRIVVDVGAGTGKLSRVLLPSRAEVIAVEPVAAMRSVLEHEAPLAQALDGTAESLPLADTSTDAIAVAQAFHWFDAPLALAEFHRVLRPGGRLGLIWNRRRRDQPLQRSIDAIIEPYRAGTPSHTSGQWRSSLERTGLFVATEELAVAFEQTVEPERFVDRIASISFVAALDDPARGEVLKRLRELAATKLEPLAYLTEVYIYERSPSLDRGVGSG